jgi:hypothetical protein
MKHFKGIIEHMGGYLLQQWLSVHLEVLLVGVHLLQFVSYSGLRSHQGLEQEFYDAALA